MLHGLPTPSRDKDAAPFWEGCDRGELLIQNCDSCHSYRWPPGPGCPFCASTESTWTRVEGQGTVYSWVIVRVPLVEALADQVPYAVGLIELDQGIRLVSTISGCDLEAIEAGLPVRVDFTHAEEASPIFTFVPA